MTKVRSLLGAVIVLVLVAGVFVTTRTDVNPITSSSVSGLATLRTMAQQSVSYEVALTNGKPTLLEFYADWCNACQWMAPTLNKLHNQHSNINFVMINVDDVQFQEQVQQYGVSGLPQITLLQPGGAVEQTLLGNVPERVLVQNLQRLIPEV